MKRCLPLLCLAMLLLPVCAAACTECDYQNTARTIPFIGWWMGLSVMALLLLRYTDFGEKSEPFDHGWITIVGILCVLYGPSLPPLLLVGWLLAFVRLIAVMIRPSSPWRRYLAAAFAAAFLVTGISMTAANWDRDEIDRMVAHPTQISWHFLVIRLEREKDLPALRKVLEKGRGFPKRYVVAALGNVGDPAVDAALLVADMERAEREGHYAAYASDYSKALAKLLHTSPSAAKPTAADWAKLLPTPTPAAPALTGASTGT